MGTITIDESPELARAQVSELENMVEVDENGKPAFYVAISQTLDTHTGWLSTPPRPIASGTELEAIQERVWGVFNTQRRFSSPHTMRWHIYRLEDRRSRMVQLFEIFREDADLLDYDKWSEDRKAKRAAEAKEAAVQERRAGMKVVGSEVP
jgi:hypothetical protein